MLYNRQTMARFVPLMVFGLSLAGLSACTPADPEPLSACTASDGDGYTINDLLVSGHSLTADLSYSGGCETHEFVLCWPSQAFMESAPVQVDLEIWHDANGDSCEAEITEDRVFDLSSLQVAYVSAYGPPPGQINVNIDGQTLNYSF